MNRSDYRKGLVIFKPPEQDRTIKLSDGRAWSSAKEGVVFFETGKYRYYTSGVWIGKLLNLLVRATRVQEIGLRIDADKIKSVPEWLYGVHGFNHVLTGRFRIEDLDKFAEFFDAIASYGVWDCYGLSSEFKSEGVFKQLPQALHHCERYPFLVEVDLDSVLLGYVRPQKSIEELTSALSQIGTSKP
jgi:hypothetical protein